MIREQTFERKFCIRNKSTLTRIPTDISTIKELPVGYVIHDATNMFTHKTHPAVNLDNKFISKMHEDKKLYVYNCMDISTNADPKQLSCYHKRHVGVKKALIDFIQQNRGNVKYITDLSTIVDKPAIQYVVNYNPLVLAKMTGMFKIRTKTELIMNTIIDTINRLSDRHNVILLPVGSDKYPYEDFIKVFERIDKHTLKHINNPDYLMLAQVCATLYSESNVGTLLDKLTENVRGKTYIGICNDDRIELFKLSGYTDYHSLNKVQIQKLISNINIMVDDNVANSDNADEFNETIDDSILKPTPDRLLGGNDKFKDDDSYVIEANMDLENEEKELIARITNDKMLSPKKREFKLKKALAYKDIVIDGVKVKDLIKATPMKLEKDTVLKLKGVSDYMRESSVTSFDQQYVDKHYERDVIKTLVSFNKVGMYLQSVEKTKMVDKLNRMYKYRVQFVDDDGKSHTIHFQLPMIDETGKCFINGNYKTLTKQYVGLPIVKISPTRVTLSSNYNKLIVSIQSRTRTSLEVQLSEHLTNNNSVKVTYGGAELSNMNVPRDYATLVNKYNLIENAKTKLVLDYENRLNGMNADIRKYETDTKSVYFGKFKDTNDSLFIHLDGVVDIVPSKPDGTIAKTNLLDVLNSRFDLGVKPSSEFAAVHILDKHLPLILMLGYKYGLSKVLRLLKVDYKLEDKRYRVEDPTVNVYSFKDKKLIIPRNPELNRLIFNGLNMMKLKNVYFEDMNSADGYYTAMTDAGISLNYLKGIEGMYDLFMDPITKDVLLQMNEPTNLRDLMIRAVQMLTSPAHRDGSSAKNFRLRSFERYPGVIYNALARAYHKYKYRGGPGVKFSITRFDVKSRIMKDPLLNNTGTINPVKSVKDMSTYSYIGDGGRAKGTITIADRKFSKDNIGITSESSTTDMNVGITCYTTADPTMVNSRGMFETKPVNELKPTNVMGATSILFPSIVNDDVKRIGFMTNQMSAYVGTKGGSPLRVRTGYDKVLAYRTDPKFAVMAKGKGKVVAIDKTNNLVKVKYTDYNKIYVYETGTLLSNNTANGFFTTHNIVLGPKIKPGATIKEGDVICYDDRYFSRDILDGQLSWNCGNSVNIALIEHDNTLEDSSTISNELADKLEFRPSYVTEIRLEKDYNIHDYIKIGESVKSTEPIIVFDKSNLAGEMSKGSKELKTALEALGQTSPKAKHSGTVSKIEVIYNCNKGDMSNSIRKLVAETERVEESKANFAKGSVQEDKFKTAGALSETAKLGTLVIDNNIIIIRFYITEDNIMGIGSKITVASSLKSVVAAVVPQMKSEDGLIIDGLMSAYGINSRIILSPLLIGCTTRILVDLEHEVSKLKGKNKIISRIVEVVNTIDPSGDNGKFWKDTLSKVSEAMLKKWIKGFETGESQIYITMPNLDKLLTMPNILKAAKKTKTKLFQRIYLYDEALKMNKLTNEKYLIVNCPVRRLQQYIDKKMSVPTDDSKIDMLTGQVMDHSQSASLSNPEIQVLNAKGLKNTTLELIKVRGGDTAAYNEYKRQLEETGMVTMSNVTNKDSRPGAVVLADVLLRSMGLDSNFVG